MTLIELQDKLKEAGAPVSGGKFMLLGKRAMCEWLDVYMGMFTCKDASENGFFQVHDFMMEPVVELQ